MNLTPGGPHMSILSGRLAVFLPVLLLAAPLSAQTTLRQAAAARGIPIGAAASADEYGPPDLLLNPVLRRRALHSIQHAGAGQRHEVGRHAAHPGHLQLSARRRTGGFRAEPTICACAATIFAGTRSSRRGCRPMPQPPPRPKWRTCSKVISTPKSRISRATYSHGTW